MDTKTATINTICDLLDIYAQIDRDKDFQIYWELEKKIVELIKSI